MDEIQKVRKVKRTRGDSADEVGQQIEEEQILSSALPRRRSIFPWMLVSVLFIALLVLGFLYYRSYVSPEHQLTRTQVQKEAQNSKWLKSLGELIVLPLTQPTIVFEITDIDNLKKTQPFLDGAQNGDILFVYQNPPQAIIYNPERDIIMKIGQVTFEQQKTDNSTVSKGSASSTKKK